MAVLFGQTKEMSTSFQTRNLSRALSPWFDVNLYEIEKSKSQHGNALRRAFNNHWQSWIQPPKTDYWLYANDGMIDLRGNKIAKSLIYWYDAPTDWRLTPPAKASCYQNGYLHWVRYQNIIHADYVFAVSAVQVDIAKQLRPGREGSVHYLPVGVDCSHFDPERFDTENSRKALGLPIDRIVVGYLGYIGVVNGRYAGQPLVEMAADLLGKYAVHFLVIGFGPGLKLFQQDVQSRRLSSNFTFTGYVPDDSVAPSLAAIDIAIDTLENGFHSLARSETKLKQYMAMGKACVATNLGENIVDMESGRCGLLAGFEKDALLKAVETLCGDSELRKRLGRNARQRASEVYDWKVLARRCAHAVLGNSIS